MYLNALDFNLGGATSPAERHAAIMATVEAAALANNGVYIPLGDFDISEELKLPSNMRFTGAGKDLTFIRLSDGAVAINNVITNDENCRNAGNGGNHDIFVADLTADCNMQRLPNNVVGDGTSGCGIGFACVDGFEVRGVASINGAKHCFDAGASNYQYNGSADSNYPAGIPSRGRFIDCYGENALDDIFTSHYSSVDIIGCEARNAGYSGSDNCNLFEVDDGSFDCRLIGNTGYGGPYTSTGIEVKGHTVTPASRRILVQGNRMVDCDEAFVVRHLGHYGGAEPLSPNASNVMLRDNLALHPKTHALVIAGYRDVDVDGFTALGKGATDTVTGEAVMAFGAVARTRWGNITIRDFPNAQYGLRITSSASNNHRLRGVNILNSGKYRGFSVGTAITDLSVEDIEVVAPSSLAANSIGILITEALVASRSSLGNYRSSGYATALRNPW